MMAKENIVTKGDGAITIHEDGTITKDTRILPNLTVARKPSDYIVSKESIFNDKKDISSFQPYIGDQLIKVMEKLHTILLETGIENPKPYMARCYRNNNVTPWHRHSMPKGYKPKQFWVAIYYMHPNWDVSFGGDLQIGLTEDHILHDVPCYSNSVAMHNGLYGHGVKKLKLGYKGDRDIFLTHWVDENL